MRCIGKGAESARMFCGIMNFPPPPTKFSKYNHILLQATRETCEHSMAEAVREAVDENDGKGDLAVAVDGSWQKRGFSSKNGLVTVTSVDTGKVIDVEVFSKHCVCPNKTKHLQNCKRNFEGYSGKMEVAGALSIFQRSQSLYNVRYTKYLGDGDSKAFTSIVENKVYGDHCSVEKLECIGHVMKRMGTRLRRLKTKMRGQKLSDGKPLCGRNRLTEAEIDRLQAYYGLAIRRNLSSVKDMQQAIWEIFLHMLSTDEKPQHGFCPSDTDTWCKFKKAELLGETYHHKNSLPVDVVEAMRPVFRDLANPELLKKCLHGGTQNPNESVNNVIWSRVPKKTFVQLKVLSLVYLQVDDHVHPGKCPAAVSSEKKQDLLHMEFYHHLPSWDMNEQMSYFSSFPDEWSRDLKSVQVLKQLSCRGLREAGWSNRRIGRHLGRSDMVVARCWQQWITEGRVYRRGGSGRPRNTNDREDRAIRRVATSAPTTSLASIQRHLPPSRHPAVSTGFCRPRATWSVTDWRRVIFSDESRFSLSDDDHRTRVWRRTGQRSDPAFIVERHTAISQGVTVWGAISWDTRSSLVVLQGTLTARRYVDDILTPIVLPMLSSRPGAIYQQDNARPHTARLSQQFLQGYDVLPWPARSPDLSPIEHVWTRWEGNCSRPEIQEN
ncbi:uncharacterized protein TNCV_3455691 [Trichonephila clavipes]|nr:uncharacterized protein TNCV_3455691 [Trichonephila clavipes]